MNEKASDYRWLDDDGAAFGSPGVEPRWTSSKKDAVSTAYSASSRVWFTVSHGTLNEVYYPTIDRPQMRDMELLFTDEETFFHEEKRDFEYDFHYVDPGAPAVRVVASDLDGRYTVTKEFIADPHHPVVLMNVKIAGDEAVVSRLKCYVLLAPHLDGGGAGNSARSLSVAGRRTLLAWKGEHNSLAVGADCGFTRSSCGYVGTSDGYQDLSTHMKMQWQFGQALNGNVAVTGEIDVARNREFTIAIAFGDGHHAALSGMMQTLSTPYAEHAKRFIDQWHRAESPAALAKASTDGGRLMRVSHNVILTHEDKTYSGAFIASASIPWGASKGDDDLGGYHLVWTRDMVQSATALLACGRTETARRALVYLACTQRPDGGFAQNFWIDGSAYWTGIQLDEVAFPIILAWRLWKVDGLGVFDVFPFVEKAAAFLVRYAPVTQQERWEENAGYSPSTLAAVISGLVCAADIARAYQASELAGFLETYADWIESHLDEWTTTEDGMLLDGVKRHYMRIRPPAEGEPFHNPGVKPGFIRLANRGPEEESEFDAREVVDGGFLELVRYGIRRADDPLMVESLKVVDACLKYETPYGPCWRRYNHDGYGQKKDGGPYDGFGQGRAWPLLGGERAHYELAAGHDVKPFITAYEKFSSIGGMLPEQVWDHDDMPEEGLYLGRSAGSAQPLVWAHAEYVKLLRSVSDGKVFDTISVVAERYAVEPGTRTFQNTVEIFQTARPFATIPTGFTLRVVDRARFRMSYTLDGWATTTTVDSRVVGYPGSFADVVMPGEPGELEFTLFWPTTADAPEHWLGHNYKVAVTSQGPETMPAGAKPQS
ncbi:glycoside hydrolase family 15 protein [Granulicella tundricola]|uniref:Glucan 1,4-alpha-glucosidase n=1 Tax=Granulicella tundricola (strain ATCC BAA-1859 / DSM 23138 / MP5ACTX9) TaxID=1198114 RepID=E8WXG9_GRATM|nr:glycoside hydrolase family 15 protein [Granulicella tundricola]ADW67502.1 Glucan 1,4-alpha-glucosidase [Granulicella tundricola MP5ACTX9]